MLSWDDGIPIGEERAWELARDTTSQPLLSCWRVETAESSYDETENPAVGEVFYYLVRLALDRRASWGPGAEGVGRSDPCP